MSMAGCFALEWSNETDAIEDAQGLWNQMHTKTEVIAE